MSFLRVLKSHPGTSLQDRGRVGWQKWGIPVSGALDEVSLQIANLIVGNEGDTPVLEIMGGGLSLQVEKSSVCFCFVGMAEAATISNNNMQQKIFPCQSYLALPGDIIVLPPPRNGAVYYFAISGGFNAPFTFGSSSTYRRARLGGFNGYDLRDGDILPLKLKGGHNHEMMRLDLKIITPKTIRIMPGPNRDHFDEAAWHTLTTSSYTISSQSDRMGLRLKGASLSRQSGEIDTQATTAGALQVPLNGLPILLLPDRQTTGGYPCIATVISADMAAVGRLSAGMSVTFCETTRHEALNALKHQKQWLNNLPSQLKRKGNLTSNNLLGYNLIGGMISADEQDQT